MMMMMTVNIWVLKYVPDTLYEFIVLTYFILLTSWGGRIIILIL